MLARTLERGYRGLLINVGMCASRCEEREVRHTRATEVGDVHTQKGVYTVFTGGLRLGPRFKLPEVLVLAGTAGANGTASQY